MKGCEHPDTWYQIREKHVMLGRKNRNDILAYIGTTSLILVRLFCALSMFSVRNTLKKLLKKLPVVELSAWQSVAVWRSAGRIQFGIQPIVTAQTYLLLENEGVAEIQYFGLSILLHLRSSVYVLQVQSWMQKFFYSNIS